MDTAPTRKMPGDGGTGPGPNREVKMLILSRKTSEVIHIGDNIRIMVVEIRGDKVRLGIEAPREIPVHRAEVLRAIQRGNES